LRELRDEINKKTEMQLKDLSMGMSNDYLIAVEEGATMVRIGSSIFGTRSYT
ncbi:MAG: YggS family pyridoxal phosphate enzyme, partial [Spirochaetota bacterium]